MIYPVLLCIHGVQMGLWGLIVIQPHFPEVLETGYLSILIVLQ